MDRIVVAAKAGAEQPWVADAAAELAQHTGASVEVVSVDGVEMEALSPLPREEYARSALESAERLPPPGPRERRAARRADPGARRGGDRRGPAREDRARDPAVRRGA